MRRCGDCGRFLLMEGRDLRNDARNIFNSKQAEERNR